MSKFLINDYYAEISDLLVAEDLFVNLQKTKDLFLETRSSGNKLLMAGNGGSAGIVSHAAVDFTKQAEILAMTFNEIGLVTALSNDYGYEHVISESFNYYSKPGDVLVCVSVSGKSPNLVNAVETAKRLNHKVVTFTGKSRDNPLFELADISFFVDSNSYNIVEGIHMIWLTSIVDMIIGKSVYDVGRKVEHP